MTTTRNSALGHLRAATARLHEELEAEAKVLPRLRSAGERPALVAAYRAMLAQAEAALRPFLPGFEAPAAAAMLNSPEEALGFHYVMQGSALGGRAILQQLRREGVDVAGLGFLNPHGAGAGAAWRQTVALLERRLAGSPAALAQAAQGARKGYAHAKACLCAEASP